MADIECCWMHEKWFSFEEKLILANNKGIFSFIDSPKPKTFMLPWWFIFVGWFLVIIVSLTAAFFTMLYGLQFEKKQQEKWLLALLISVSQDVFVSQPIKIFAFAMFIAFVIRKPNNVDVNEENDILMKDDQWIQESWQKVKNYLMNYYIYTL